MADRLLLNSIQFLQAFRLRNLYQLPSPELREHEGSRVRQRYGRRADDQPVKQEAAQQPTSPFDVPTRLSDKNQRLHDMLTRPSKTGK